jgi:hypothetical protein
MRPITIHNINKTAQNQIQAYFNTGSPKTPLNAQPRKGFKGTHEVPRQMVVFSPPQRSGGGIQI